MYGLAAPTKNLSGKVKSHDAAATIPIRPTTSDHAADDHIDVIGWVPFAGNHRVAAIADRAARSAKMLFFTAG